MIGMNTRPQIAIKSGAAKAETVTHPLFTTVQRKCACRGTSGVGGECADCKKKRSFGRLATGNAGPAPVPPIVHDVLRSTGQPLDAATRAFFEPRFGYDFSHVRVHTDSTAARSVKAVSALAYTVGPHIVFGTAAYAPQTTRGRLLLAHELTHVLQQAHAPSSGRHGMSLANDPEELEANRIANVVVSRSGEKAMLHGQPPQAVLPQLVTPIRSKGGGHSDGVHLSGALALGASASPAWLLRNGDGGEKSRESRPKDAPTGTRPIDQTPGMDRDKIHKIKDGVGAGPKDWVGISPEGDVITSDGDGNAVNNGPFPDYLPRSALPTWVWALIAAGTAIGVILLLLSGAGGLLVFA